LYHRLLLCAPSNGAVDELVERLVTVGVYDRNGKVVKPRTIRIGRPPPTASDAVKAVTLQVRVAAALKVHPLRIEADDCARAIDKLQLQLNTINKQLDNPSTTASTSSSSTDSKSTTDSTASKAVGSGATAVMSSRELLIERKRVTIELGVKRRRRREAFAALDAERKRVRNNILDNAQVRCANNILMYMYGLLMLMYSVYIIINAYIVRECGAVQYSYVDSVYTVIMLVVASV
jgi:AAA domain